MSAAFGGCTALRTQRGRSRPQVATESPVLRSSDLSPGKLREDRRLAALAERLTGPGAVAVAAAPADLTGLLFPEERVHLAGACEKRRWEFSTARACARRALERLGLPAAPITVKADRSPVWPNGVLGSISHASDRCVAIVEPAGDGVAGVGIDIEPFRGLEAGLEPIICTSAEQAWLQDHPVAARPRLRLIFFAAKEAVYKCQSPVTEAWLGFHDVEVRLDLARREFEAGCVGRRTGWGRDMVVEGRFDVEAGRLLCLAKLAWRARRHAGPSRTTLGDEPSLTEAGCSPSRQP